MSVDNNLQAMSNYIGDRENQVLSLDDQGNLTTTPRKENSPQKYIEIPKLHVSIEVDPSKDIAKIKDLVGKTLSSEDSNQVLRSRVIEQLHNAHEADLEELEGAEFIEQDEIPKDTKNHLKLRQPVYLVKF